MKFTVILLYPDYLSDCSETFLDHVDEDNVEAAEKEAKSQAAWENEVEDPDDFKVLAVFAGHLEDIKHG